VTGLIVEKALRAIEPTYGHENVGASTAIHFLNAHQPTRYREPKSFSNWHPTTSSRYPPGSCNLHPIQPPSRLLPSRKSSSILNSTLPPRFHPLILPYLTPRSSHFRTTRRHTLLVDEAPSTAQYCHLLATYCEFLSFSWLSPFLLSDFDRSIPFMPLALSVRDFEFPSRYLPNSPTILKECQPYSCPRDVGYTQYLSECWNYRSVHIFTEVLIFHP